MRRSVSAKEPFVRKEVSREEARTSFRPKPAQASVPSGRWPGRGRLLLRNRALRRSLPGPHIQDTASSRVLHLLGFSAITPGGPEAAVTLQRIRGVGFPTEAGLKEYLKLRSEAEARDHRSLGQKLELFTFFDEAPGFPAILPNGIVVLHELERFVREHLKEAGYSEIRTPLMWAQSVYETSGHWEHYRENMFLTEADNRVFGWKPMNCPGSMLIFKSRARSYRELPLRLAEFAPLHRFEASGTLHGLTRVREFVQDDAHLFVTEEQIEPEIQTLLTWIARAFSTFRLKWSYELSTRPAQFLGEKETWDRAEAMLEKILRGSGIEYRVSPGEGAFYGPKIDIHIRDSLGRPWQTGTIQLDYQIPEQVWLEVPGPEANSTLHRHSPGDPGIVRAVPRGPARAYGRTAPPVARRDPGTDPPGHGATVRGGRGARSGAGRGRDPGPSRRNGRVAFEEGADGRGRAGSLRHGAGRQGVGGGDRRASRPRYEGFSDDVPTRAPSVHRGPRPEARVRPVDHGTPRSDDGPTGRPSGPPGARHRARGRASRSTVPMYRTARVSGSTVGVEGPRHPAARRRGS